MANISVGNGGSGKRNKPKKMNLRVDFTPMVDMNMLLITFFMFCTTLSIPQVMDIVMPTKDKGPGGEIPKSKAITLLLGENDKVYYYLGMPDYDDPGTLKETNFGVNGLRDVLLKGNEKLVSQANKLRTKRRSGEITETEYRNRIAEIKKSDESMIAVIKPTDASSYRNLVDALDEMLICNLGKYSIVELEDGDRYLLDNYKNVSGLTANAQTP